VLHNLQLQQIHSCYYVLRLCPVYGLPSPIPFALLLIVSAATSKVQVRVLLLRGHRSPKHQQRLFGEAPSDTRMKMCLANLLEACVSVAVVAVGALLLLHDWGHRPPQTTSMGPGKPPSPYCASMRGAAYPSQNNLEKHAVVIAWRQVDVHDHWTKPSRQPKLRCNTLRLL
jgi:hypothetical protein